MPRVKIAESERALESESETDFKALCNQLFYEIVDPWDESCDILWPKYPFKDFMKTKT